MPSVRKGVQPELELDNALEEAHRIQAVRMRAVPQGVPAEGRPAETQGDAAR